MRNQTPIVNGMIGFMKSPFSGPNYALTIPIGKGTGVTVAHSPRLQQPLRLRQLHRHDLAHAAFGHRHPEQPVHADHGQRVVGDGDEAGVGAFAHFFEEVAEALDIVVVERGVDLVEDADRRGVGEEDGEDQRERGQRLLAAGEQGQRLRLLAGRLGDEFEAGFQRIVGFDQLQFGRGRPGTKSRTGPGNAG